MQKPDNKTVKEFILQKTAKDLQVDPDIVDSVIGWSYKKLNESVHNNKEIEISGIGVLRLSQAKLKRTIARYEKMLSGKIEEHTVISLTQKIEELKTRLDEQN